MKNGKPEKDYYKQLDGWVRMFEQCGYCPVRIEVVTDKIVWCWKWKKIITLENIVIVISLAGFPVQHFYLLSVAHIDGELSKSGEILHIYTSIY